ncbi:MAG: outer membrane beta-barrel protein [Vicinamibacterales bacterium]
MRVSTLVALLLVAAATAGPALAQVQEDEAPEGRFHAGEAVSFTPALVFVFGRDSNMIRTDTGSAGSEYYVVPQIEGWVGKRRLRLNFVSALEYGEQTTAGSQLNHFNMARFDALGRRVSFSAQGSHRDHYAPPTDFIGFEIGLRSRRIEDQLESSVSLSPPGRLTYTVVGRRAQLRYDADARYLGASLEQNLNRNGTSVEGVVGMELTPLSSILVSATRNWDRFINAPERDGNGYRLLFGTQFEPRALISGRALAGFMRYTTLQSGRDFGGPTYVVGLTTSRGPFLMDVSGSRIVDFSFDPSRGFYIVSNLETFLSLRLRSGWDLLGRGGWGTLSSREVPGGDSTRRIWSVRGALARRLIQSSQVGLEVERYTWAGEGGFSGVRMTAFLTYGSNRLQKLDRPVPGVP